MLWKWKKEMTRLLKKPLGFLTTLVGLTVVVATPSTVRLECGVDCNFYQRGTVVTRTCMRAGLCDLCACVCVCVCV